MRPPSPSPLINLRLSKKSESIVNNSKVNKDIILFFRILYFVSFDVFIQNFLTVKKDGSHGNLKTQ